MLVLSGCGTAAQNDFALSLTLVSEENSDDSNSQTETLELDGTRGEYTWVYDGYAPNEDFEREKKESFTLSEEQVESLKLFLKNKGLDQDLVEEQSTGEMGNSVELNLELEIAGENTAITISGMSAIYGSGTGESNLENFATVEAAQDLIYTVKDLGGLYDE